MTTDLSAIAETMATADSEWRKLCENTKLDVKDQGEHFVGRDDEVKRVESQLKKTVRSTKAKPNQVTGIIVCGAMGAGKTTLMQEVQERLRKDGVTVLQLQATHLRDPKTFSDAIQSATEPNVRSLLKTLGRGTGSVVARIIDAGGAALVAKQMNEAGIPTDPSEVNAGALTNTLEAWRERRTANINDVLKTLGYLHPKGVVIWIERPKT